MQIMTRRLILREWEESDWVAAHAIHSDPEVMRYMTAEPETEEETRATIGDWMSRAAKQPRTSYSLAMILQTEGRLIGRAGLYITADSRIAYIGYHLDRAYWGQGYITEAMRPLIQFGFEQLGLHRIYAECHPANTGSARVMERLGMRREAHLRQNLWAKGEWWDTLVYAILDHEWKAGEPT